MTLTIEENELLTRVGPGTPGGNLLRRYWHPVAPITELTTESPTRFVRLLGEDLVLFRDRSGTVGLIQDHCPHRGASMLYGRVEERGIACAYHGWLYDARGHCLETPAEPAESLFHLTVKATAYPVRELVGLYWAYLGPEPVPEIPHLDIWYRKDGRRRVLVKPVLDCNWFAAAENSVDSSHSEIMHSVGALRPGGPRLPNTTRGAIDTVQSYDYIELPIGIMKKRTMKNGRVDAHPYLFPTVLRHQNETQIRIPLDDTHTQIIYVKFTPNADGAEIDEPAELPVEYDVPYKNPVDRLHPFTRFTMHDTAPEDHMAWETQGSLADRPSERLATADRGIVMLRQMMFREIKKVAEGLDPINVYRDPDHPLVDTNHTEQMLAPSRTTPIEA
jgi:5,5'-dehydrodivanillate O-demethylase